MDRSVRTLSDEKLPILDLEREPDVVAGALNRACEEVGFFYVTNHGVPDARNHVTTMADKLPRRTHPTHGVRIMDGLPTIVFDTVCTKNRLPWLACHEVHHLLCDIWREATAWLMGRYMILPDHIHFFAGATETDVEYDNWVTYWKW